MHLWSSITSFLAFDPKAPFIFTAVNFWIFFALVLAVDAFLAGRLKWADIAAVIESALQNHAEYSEVLTSSHVIDADRKGRLAANKVIGR